MRIAKCKPKFTNVNCCAADAPLRNAVRANVRCGGAAWSNADEGGERNVAPPLRSFARTASAAAQPQRCALLDYKLLPQSSAYSDMDYLFLPIINHLVDINFSFFNHFLNQVKQLRQFPF